MPFPGAAAAGTERGRAASARARRRPAGGARGPRSREACVHAPRLCLATIRLKAVGGYTNQLKRRGHVQCPVHAQRAAGDGGEVPAWQRGWGRGGSWFMEGFAAACQPAFCAPGTRVVACRPPGPLAPRTRSDVARGRLCVRACERERRRAPGEQVVCCGINRSGGQASPSPQARAPAAPPSARLLHR